MPVIHAEKALFHENEPLLLRFSFILKIRRLKKREKENYIMENTINK